MHDSQTTKFGMYVALVEYLAEIKTLTTILWR